MKYVLAVFSILASASQAQAVAPPSSAENAARRQLVMISFDGAHSNALWTRSLALARATNAHFTYFLSCTYLINPKDRGLYRAPHQKAGRSATGFAQSAEEVQERLGHIWQAHLEGHEIGSHACGHFDGKDWSEADWKSEFGAFDGILANAWKTNGVGDREPSGWQSFVKNDIRGFRAPYLSTGRNLVAALSAHGFSYDASLVSKGPALPEKADGITRFALPRIAEGPQERLIIGMDYNLYVRHSAGKEDLAHEAIYEARTLAAFRKAFEEQYNGKRIPLQLGFHFVEMNGGAYWNALTTFVRETCNKPDVACVTYPQAMKLLEAKGNLKSSGL